MSLELLPQNSGSVLIKLLILNYQLSWPNPLKPGSQYNINVTLRQEVIQFSMGLSQDCRWNRNDFYSSDCRCDIPIKNCMTSCRNVTLTLYCEPGLRCQDIPGLGSSYLSMLVCIYSIIIIQYIIWLNQMWHRTW